MITIVSPAALLGIRRKRLVISKGETRTVFSERTGPLHRFVQLTDESLGGDKIWHRTACGEYVDQDNALIVPVGSLGTKDLDRLCKACFRSSEVIAVDCATAGPDVPAVELVTQHKVFT